MHRRQFMISSLSLIALSPLLLAKTAPQSLSPKIKHHFGDSLVSSYKDSLGNLYRISSDDYKLSLLDHNSQEHWSIEGLELNKPRLNFPTKLVSDDYSRLYIVEKEPNTIKFIQPGQKKLHTLKLDSRDTIVVNDILANTDGTLYIADSFNHRILHVSHEGKILSHVGTLGSQLGSFNFPTHLQKDPWGNIHVLERGNNRISIIDSKKKIATSYGGFGNQRGHFTQLSDFKIDTKGNTYTLDRSSRDLQCFSPSGSVNAITLLDKLTEGIPHSLSMSEEQVLSVHTLLSSKEINHG